MPSCAAAAPTPNCYLLTPNFLRFWRKLTLPANRLFSAR